VRFQFNTLLINTENRTENERTSHILGDDDDEIAYVGACVLTTRKVYPIKPRTKIDKQSRWSD